MNLDYEHFDAIQKEIREALRDFSVAMFRETRQLDCVRPVATDAFEGACKTVFNLMNTDTLLRFKVRVNILLSV